MWIEITASTGVYNSLKVTPLAGVWIEIRRPWAASATWRTVTPLAGVWIEIGRMHIPHYIVYVTPLAGVWIEII